MYFSSALAAAFAVGPIVVSATAGSLGYALGNTKTDGSCKLKADYKADMAALASTSNIVRTYTSAGCNTAQQILPAASESGFTVILGMWPDTDDAFNLDLAALQAAIPGNEDAVYAITVGSEALYRGSLSAKDLLSKIQQVQSQFDVKVGTADSWNLYANGSADPLINGGVDILLCNAFAFWEGADITNATKVFLDNIQQAFGRIQSVNGSTTAIELFIGETGWPTTGGTNYESAIAGTDNAAKFFSQGVCAALDWGYNTFYFEAFDEPAKPDSIGQDGSSANEQNWGAFDASRNAKFSLSC